MSFIWRNNQGTSPLSLETFCTWMAFCVEYANATLATCKNYSYNQTLENALIIASENKILQAKKAQEKAQEELLAKQYAEQRAIQAAKAAADAAKAAKEAAAAAAAQAAADAAQVAAEANSGTDAGDTVT